MAGLAQRSRPVLGGGNYLLPLEFKLHSKIKEFGKDQGLIKLNEFPLSSSIVSANVDVLIPIIRGDFKLKSKVSQSKEDGEYLYFSSTTDFEMKPKVSNEVRENLAALIGNIKLQPKLSASNSHLRASNIPKAIVPQSANISYLLESINADRIVLAQDASYVEFKGGISDISTILKSTDKTWIRRFNGNNLILEFGFDQAVDLSGFSILCTLDNPYSDNGINSITVEDISGETPELMFNRSLGLSQKFTTRDFMFDSKTLTKARVTFVGRFNQEVNLQYFNFF